MRAIRLLCSLALLFAASPHLVATVPAGKTQQLSSPDQVPEGLAKSDWASIRDAYEAGRHAFQTVEGGWQARNPGQQWTAKFDGRGFVAQPRGADWQWGLEFKSYGFGEQQTKVGGCPTVRNEGQRLSYQWDDSVQEWFVNDVRGLEHGFTITRRPAVAENLPSGATPLSFTLATRGSLRPSVSSDALTIHFRDASDAPVLTYSSLKVWDADGKILTSRFESAGGNQVRLLVEENGARYPLTIDPIAQQSYLKAGNNGGPSDDFFGFSVAVSGDTVVVGAIAEDSSTTGVNSTPNESASDSGAAYVFTRSGTTWSQQAYLKASNTGADDRFGYSLAVSGDTVVVGAYGEDSSTTGVNSTPDDAGGTLFNSGAAYVFTRSGTTWSQQAYLKASNTGFGDTFGSSVAVSGDTVVVGADQEDSSTTGVNSTSNNNATYSGAAYVFTRSGTTWSQQAYLKASNTGVRDLFGCSVAVSGDTVVVGADQEDSGTTGVNSTPNDSAGYSGAAYVFTRSGTMWSQQAYLKASNTGADDNFGHSVAVSGDTVVVSANFEDSSTTGVNSTPNESAVNSGAAYVFTRSGTMWSQQAYLKASNTGEWTNFGYSVAVSGDTVIVGANEEDSSTTGVNSTPDHTGGRYFDSGAAYVFTRSGTTWSQQAYLKASNTGASDRFGTSVAVSGDTVVVGAYREDSSMTGVNSTPNESASDSGAAYVFTRSGTTWSQQAYLKASNTEGGDLFGTSVAVSGDTLVVGALGEDSSTTGVNSTPNDTGGPYFNSGAAYVFTRSGTMWSQQAYLKASNTGESDLFGTSVAVSGDTLVVGASHEDSHDNFSSDSGAAYVFTRSGTTWSQQAYLKASNTEWKDAFGTSVAVSGDTVVVGANEEDSSTTGVNSTPDESASNSGAAYVFTRSGTRWSQQAYLKASNTGANDYFGSSVAVSGDTVVVGANYEDSSTTGVNSTPNESASASGAAYVFTRSGTTWNQQAYLKASNTEGSDLFGTSVAVSGDTVVVGAYGEDSSTTGVNSTPNESAVNSGAAYVFTRSGTTWSQQAYLKASNTGGSDYFGTSVAVSGDTVVVGANQEASSTTGVNSSPNESARTSGAAYIFSGLGPVIVIEPSEIAINRAGTDIANNTMQAFGARVVGTSSDLVFTILNTGTGPLTLTGTPKVAVSGSSDYTVTSQPASSITGPNGSTTFTVRFAPSSIGPKSAVLSIPNNDTNENPFTINLSGSGVTAETAYNITISSTSSLIGSSALPTAIPFGDGVENLLKYAFNMNLSGPDSHRLVIGTGSSGLPAIQLTGSGSGTMLQVEFLRRKGSGLVYTPMRSSNLAPGSFLPMSAPPVVTSIDDNWERVVVQESADPAALSKAFARVEVKFP